MNIYEQLIEACQKVLNDAWIRTKREAGISEWTEKRMYRKLQGK